MESNVMGTMKHCESGKLALRRINLRQQWLNMITFILRTQCGLYTSYNVVTLLEDLSFHVSNVSSQVFSLTTTQAHDQLRVLMHIYMKWRTPWISPVQ